jgi:hypothetical protein
VEAKVAEAKVNLFLTGLVDYNGGGWGISIVATGGRSIENGVMCGVGGIMPTIESDTDVVDGVD